MVHASEFHSKKSFVSKPKIFLSVMENKRCGTSSPRNSTNCLPKQDGAGTNLPTVRVTTDTWNNGSLKPAVPTKYSSSIPLPPTHVSRTESEVQLAMDIAAAERHDERMFHRLIYGMHSRHQKQISSKQSGVVAAATSHHIDFVDSTNINSYGPVATIARIVETHHANLNDSVDRIVNVQQQHCDIDDDQTYTSLALTENHRFLQIPYVTHMSESALYENDWSITGYQDATEATATNKEYCNVHQQQNVTATQFNEIEDDCEEMFILDL
jgi:hypothetical protein